MARPPARLIMLVALLLLRQAERPIQQTLPLPAAEPFFASVRENMARSQIEQNRFAYKERRTELRMNPFGRIGTGAVRVYDVVPAADGMTVTRRLIEHDGKPVNGATAEQRERLERTSRRTTGRSMNDVISTLQFAIDRREILDGRPAIVVTFKARPDAKPQTRQGKLAKAFAGSIWVDEAAKEVKKVDAVAVDDMSVGFGVVARLNEGAKVSATREPVGHNMWLPTSIRLVGDGRALLFRKLTLDYAIEWFDYRETAK